MINIDDLIGKPFKEGGNGKEGYDCYTLSREVCKRGGINLPSKQTQMLATVENIKNRSEAISIGKKEDYIRLKNPEPFCIVTFSLRPPFVNHMGVMVDRYHFIHIMKKRLATIEKINHKFWKSKVEGFYRYADNADDNNTKSL